MYLFVCVCVYIYIYIYSWELEENISFDIFYLIFVSIQEHLDLLLTGLREQIHSPNTKEAITKAIGK